MNAERHPQKDKAVTALEARINNCQKQLEKLNRQRNFPYVYIVVAIPTTVAFLVLTYISRGLIDLTSAITASLFFSLLITCAYLVLFQPGREEQARELEKRCKKLIRDRNRLEAGVKGEMEIAYQLKWLPPDYITVNGIKLASPGLDSQQFDHLVVGPNGVFHLETKNIQGVIIISEGEWTLIRPNQNRMAREVMRSPRFQVNRHEQVLRRIFKAAGIKDAPVFSVIVMANPNTIVHGEEPGLPVVNKDNLNDFIISFPHEPKLSKGEIRQLSLLLIKAVVEETLPVNEELVET